MVSSRAMNAQLEADREDAWHLPLSLEEGRWSPTGRSPGSGSLPLGSFPRPAPRWFLTCRAWPASPPRKGERNYRMRGLAKSGDARLLEVRLELFDGWHAVDFIRLDVHELFLGGVDEVVLFGDFDVRRIRNTKREQLHNGVRPDFGALGEVHLFQCPENA